MDAPHAAPATSPDPERAAAAVRGLAGEPAEIAIVLGSGLGPLADEIEAPVSVSYGEVPGMPVSSAPGHAGRFVLGRLAGRRVVAMQGRVHLYEGFSSAQCAFGVRVMYALGARTLVVSNACGGLAPHFRAGELMAQLDLINATGQNPLTGPNDDAVGPRFPVMFDCYDPDYLETARAVAREQGVMLREGVYLAIPGPSYATRAELRAYRAWGADAIGMSTVHEVLVARYLGMRVLGLSTVTDMALPDRSEHATGDEVLAVAARSGAAFRDLVKGVLPRL